LRAFTKDHKLYIAELEYDRDSMLHDAITGALTTSQLASEVETLMTKIVNTMKMATTTFDESTTHLRLRYRGYWHRHVLPMTVAIKEQVLSGSERMHVKGSFVYSPEDYSRRVLAYETGLSSLFKLHLGLYMVKKEREKQTSNASVLYDLQAREAELEEALTDILAQEAPNLLVPLTGVLMYDDVLYVNNDYTPPAAVRLNETVQRSLLPSAVQTELDSIANMTDVVKDEVAQFLNLDPSAQDVLDQLAAWEAAARLEFTFGTSAQWLRVVPGSRTLDIENAETFQILSYSAGTVLDLLLAARALIRRGRPFEATGEAMKDLTRAFQNLKAAALLKDMNSETYAPKFVIDRQLPPRYYALLKQNALSALSASGKYLEELHLELNPADANAFAVALSSWAELSTTGSVHPLAADHVALLAEAQGVRDAYSACFALMHEIILAYVAAIVASKSTIAIDKLTMDIPAAGLAGLLHSDILPKDGKIVLQ